LISAARCVPPVIDEMMSGARSGRTEERGAQIDVGERDLRQRFVAQPDLLPAGRRARSDIVLETHVEVP